MTRKVKTRHALVLSLILLILVGMLYGIVWLTDMSPAWQQIRVGMPREKIHTMLPDIQTDMYELKGYDFTHQSITLGKDIQLYVICLIGDHVLR